MKNSVIVVTHHKTGTVWMDGVFKAIARDVGAQYVDFRSQYHRLGEALREPFIVLNYDSNFREHASILDRDDAKRKPGSVGVPPPFYEMRIVDEGGFDLPPREVGEIIGRGPITMPGYLGRDDETEAALRGGWLHSGDLGYVDEDGFLYLVDRKKDMIDSGGVKVYPRDIEEIAARHPAVHEVAVFGIPDAKWGETPLAAVVLRPVRRPAPRNSATG